MGSCTPVITTADSGDEVSGGADELIEYEFSGSEEDGYCSDELGSGDNSSDISDEGECTCGGWRTHSRFCPANPRNVGNRTGGVSTSVARAQSTSVAIAQSTSVARAQSPSSDCLDSEGEGIVHCESPKTFAITGTPTPSWREDAVAFLGTLTDAPLVKECEDVRPIECLEIAPHIRDSIRPDGNCMYRAISKQVTGSQENHMALRLAMIQFMLHEDHAVAVARLMNVKFGGSVRDDHERKRRAVAALQGYIRKHQVNSQGTWGTEKEIRVIATMLQLEIFTFSGISKGRRGWEHFLPVFSKPTCMSSFGLEIFLYHNRSGDHYDCVIPSL